MDARAMMYQPPSKDKSDKKRQRQQPPNEAWLDAIMSNTRTRDASAVYPQHPYAPHPSIVSPAASATLPHIPGMPPNGGLPPPSSPFVPGEWHHQPPPNGTFLYPHSSPGVPLIHQPRGYTDAQESRSEQFHLQAMRQIYELQLTCRDAVLSDAMSVALQEMVGERDCCFFAKGVCHLCGSNDQNLVAVVNFCPEFQTSHSLCREHLRSMHRVRMEDLFAGKNRPKASRRSLKCTVCARSCPCSKCQLEKQQELTKYKHWLAQELEMTAGEARRLMHDTPSRNAAYESGNFSYPVETIRQDQGSYAYNEIESNRHPRTITSSLPEQNCDREGRAPRNTAADPKHGLWPRIARNPKQAAKTLPPTHASVIANGDLHQGTQFVRGLHGSEPLGSPPASHVLNCEESEKSLVRLLSSLNRDIAPDGQFLAESKEAHQPHVIHDDDLEKSNSVQLPQRGSSPVESLSTQAQVVSAHGNSTDHHQLTSSVLEGSARVQATIQPKPTLSQAVLASDQNDTTDARAQKRKREINHAVAITTNNKRNAHEKNVVHTESIDETSPYSKQAPAPLQTTQQQDEETVTPLSRGKKILKRKQNETQTRTKEVPPEKTAPPSSRGRRISRSSNGSQSAPSHNSKGAHDRKYSQTGKGTNKGRKEPKTSSKDISKRQPSTKGMAQENDQEDHDDDDESELDANLDYCEVCRAAGDLVCCDVCPRSFHLGCLNMKESDLPEGDWQCAECKKSSHFEGFALFVRKYNTVQRKCLEIVRCLKSHPFAKPFLTPVENVPLYDTVVEKPMDLTTIESNLKKEKYVVAYKAGLDAFANDVRLIWSNCKLFNDDGSGIARAADDLAAGFEMLFKDVAKLAVDGAPKKAQKDSLLSRKSNIEPKSVKDRLATHSTPPISSQPPTNTSTNQHEQGESWVDASIGTSSTPSEQSISTSVSAKAEVKDQPDELSASSSEASTGSTSDLLPKDTGTKEIHVV